MDPLRFNMPEAFQPISYTQFLYSNLSIQEALTTIRYGIEARKELVFLTGEAGLGKSMLLQKTYTDLGSNFIGTMTSDPRLNFTDILRLILRGLAGENASDDELTLLRTCQLQLRTRAQRQQTVALICDNAQHLSDLTLSRFVQTFLVTDSATLDGHLLQIVLAGRPQLQDKLLKAAHVLRAVKLPIMCELHRAAHCNGFCNGPSRASVNHSMHLARAETTVQGISTPVLLKNCLFTKKSYLTGFPQTLSCFFQVFLLCFSQTLSL